MRILVIEDDRSLREAVSEGLRDMFLRTIRPRRLLPVLVLTARFAVQRAGQGVVLVIDVHSSRLRRKLDRAGAPALLHTVRGAGVILGGPTP